MMDPGRLALELLVAALRLLRDAESRRAAQRHHEAVNRRFDAVEARLARLEFVAPPSRTLTPDPVVVRTAIPVPTLRLTAADSFSFADS
jgi:hypothetical protein